MTPTPIRRTWLRILVVASVMALALGDGGLNAAAAKQSSRLQRKLDTHLTAVLTAGISEAQRVIVRVRPGTRPGLKSALSAHGDSIVAEHASIDALTAVVHADDLEIGRAHV